MQAGGLRLRAQGSSHPAGFSEEEVGEIVERCTEARSPKAPLIKMTYDKIAHHENKK
uniref:Uncharacterized protein n=1 Tax=Candidatus Kentrum eta TaxID=2126337 RepID=A0A450UG81_9GAMM|nr:MAG: hypothetical protein BECKH772B_GA0070898_1001822 [Candidatus Kentron sp. H]VFJ99946.1 MAG: hypothetical protein BECKH772A_GA0070896_101773 [Candidatus Kentron sp. H]